MPYYVRYDCGELNWKNPSPLLALLLMLTILSDPSPFSKNDLIRKKVLWTYLIKNGYCARVSHFKYFLIICSEVLNSISLSWSVIIFACAGNSSKNWLFTWSNPGAEKVWRTSSKLGWSSPWSWSWGNVIDRTWFLLTFKGSAAVYSFTSFYTVMFFVPGMVPDCYKGCCSCYRFSKTYSKFCQHTTDYN